MTPPYIPYQEYNITWNNIAITIRYTPQYPQIVAMAHLEIKRDDAGQLPITETGYKSHFIYKILIEDKGGPVEFVTAWLNEYSLKKAWKQYVQDQQQLRLF